MRSLNKVLLPLISLTFYSTFSFAASSKGSGFQNQNLQSYLDSSGVVATTHTPDAAGFAMALLSLVWGCAILIGMFVMVYGGVKFVKSQSHGGIADTRMLIASLLFCGLFTGFGSTLGILGSSSCGASNPNSLYECVKWTDEGSGITGDLKEKVNKVTSGNFDFTEFMGVYSKVVMIIQAFAAGAFLAQLFKLYSVVNGSDRNGKLGMTVVVLILYALIVDLPHTIDMVYNGSIEVVSYFKPGSST